MGRAFEAHSEQVRHLRRACVGACNGQSTDVGADGKADPVTHAHLVIMNSPISVFKTRRLEDDEKKQRILWSSHPSLEPPSAEGFAKAPVTPNRATRRRRLGKSPNDQGHHLEPVSQTDQVVVNIPSAVAAVPRTSREVTRSKRRPVRSSICPR